MDSSHIVKDRCSTLKEAGLNPEGNENPLGKRLCKAQGCVSTGFRRCKGKPNQRPLVLKSLETSRIRDDVKNLRCNSLSISLSPTPPRSFFHLCLSLHVSISISLFVSFLLLLLHSSSSSLSPFPSLFILSLFYTHTCIQKYPHFSMNNKEMQSIIILVQDVMD